MMIGAIRHTAFFWPISLSPRDHHAADNIWGGSPTGGHLDGLNVLSSTQFRSATYYRHLFPRVSVRNVIPFYHWYWATPLRLILSIWQRLPAVACNRKSFPWWNERLVCNIDIPVYSLNGDMKLHEVCNTVSFLVAHFILAGKVLIR